MTYTYPDLLQRLADSLWRARRTADIARRAAELAEEAADDVRRARRAVDRWQGTLGASRLDH